LSRVMCAPRIPSQVVRQHRSAPLPAWEAPAKAAILLGCAAIIAGALATGAVFTSFHHLAERALFKSYFWLGLTWTLVCYAALVWRVILWLRYRPMESVPDHKLPTVSVIIPAFNEGALVRQSILSVAASRYPAEKLQVIVIDDGSADDTWEHIEAAVAELPSHINAVTLRHARNQGKRRALYNGFRHATGEAIVTVDSDTIVDPTAIRNGVTPLVRESDVGAVAGCVEVLNPRASIITRFLKATFSLSFKFVRAYQNEIRGVFCTPGAISIYRASVVRRVADEWLNQTFLGLPSTIGEDRAMTNLILRSGYVTAYQQNARVWSKMPTNYVGMCKMLLRWARSNIRETIVLNRFLFTNFRPSGRHLTAFRVNMLLVLATLIVPYLLVGNGWSLAFQSGTFALRSMALVIAYGATMAAVYYRNERDHDWIWLMAYEFFWVIGLAWIMPYAALTLRRTGWLTRGSGAGHAVPAPETVPAGISLVGPMPAGAPVPSAA
jgi:hyaluronan synthase